MLPTSPRRPDGPERRLLLALVLSAAAYAAESPAPVQRWAEAVPPAREPAPPLALPVDDTWNAINARTGRLPNGLAVEVSGFWCGIERSVSLDANRYNVLEVRMQAEAGAMATLAWRGEYSAAPAHTQEAPQSSWSIIGAGEMHTYVWRLDEKPNRWRGRIDSIFFAPADAETIVKIESFRFRSEPRTAPVRLTLDNTAMEAFFGSQPPWTLAVPEGAVFEAHLGMLPVSWEGGDKGAVRFVAHLSTGEGAEEVLFARQFTPQLTESQRQWVRVERSLAAYAGQTVTLRLEVEPFGDSHGDYAYWGNPLVYSRAERDVGTPVILVSCDTLRADHVSCYGYKRPTTPVLDRFAEEDAVRFEDPITPEGYTLPAHMSMFTGLYPKNHQVTKMTNLAEEVVTLTELLRGRGYVSGGFTGQQWWMWPERGFYQGFDIYNVPHGTVRHVYETWPLMMDWLDAHRHGPFFLFFHNFDVHMRVLPEGGKGRFQLPYDPMDARFRVFSREFDASKMFQGEEKTVLQADALLGAYRGGLIDLSEEEHAYLTALYDDCVLMVDHQIGQLFEYLRREELYDPALIIVTADHGETLNERGYYGHTSTHEEVCRVPMLIKFPHGAHAGKTYAPQVSLVDLYATVADVLGIDAPPTDGVSLRALLQGRAQPRAYEYIVRSKWQAVRGPVWKYHRHLEGGREWTYFYNIDDDPLEMDDRAHEKPEALADFEKLRSEFYSYERGGWHIRFLHDRNWPVTAVLTADEPIVECLCRFDYTDIVPIEVRADNVVRWHTDRARFAELIVRTASGRGTLSVRFQSTEPVVVHQGEETHAPAQQGRYTLDLDERDYSAQPEPGGGRGPEILVWHVPAERQSQAVTPDEETQQQLRALGYFD